MSHDDDRLDDELRGLAHDSVGRQRSAVSAAEIEEALSSVRDASGVARRSRRVPGRRSAWLLVAAAAVAGLAVGAIVWWPSGDSGDRLASGNGEGSPTTIDAALRDEHDAAPGDEPDAGADTDGSGPTTVLPADTEADTTVPALPDQPSVVFDRFGDQIATFRIVDGRAVVEPEPTFFTRLLLDHLLNRTDVLGDTSAMREDQLFRGGLRIHTTFDPEMQADAEAARDRLPDNVEGIDAAIVAIDTRSGAVRAVVDGDELDGGLGGRSQVLTPRHTGSAIKSFVLAAALQAGAQPGDEIDGRRGCVLPGPWDASEEDGGLQPVLQINGGVAGFIGSLRDTFARSITCGAARLSHIVGLERVVDTIYRMAASDYLSPELTPNARVPIEPVTDLAIGVNPMSPLDMASGMQSIANDGVHHEPHLVEFIDDRDGARIHTDAPDGTPVLDAEAARNAVDVLKGVVTYGTGRRHALEAGRPAIGKTGTQQGNTDAWFVGATPELTTAVWVGDPVGPIEMVNLPELAAAGVPQVQGGTFPAEIWKAFTDAALAGEPVLDWAAPAPPERPNARLVLPGWECLVADPDAPLDENGGAVRVPLEPDDIGTTVPPGLIDPDAPIPSVPTGSFVEACEPSDDGF